MPCAISTSEDRKAKKRAWRRAWVKRPAERLRRRLYMQEWRARHAGYDAAIQRRRKRRIKAGLHIVTPRPPTSEPWSGGLYAGGIEASVYIPPKGLIAMSLLGAVVR